MFKKVWIKFGGKSGGRIKQLGKNGRFSQDILFIYEIFKQ